MVIIIYISDFMAEIAFGSKFEEKEEYFIFCSVNIK